MKVLASSLIAVASGQFDGNPFGWDRIRRCDHFQYDPPCGACEGVGGIVWGDDNDDYTPTSCEEVDPATVDKDNLKRPVWAANFHMTSHEILIGRKTDPGCFQAFPENDSSGEHCYKPQEVELYSDLGHGLKRAIYLAANQAGNLGIKGNVSSVIIHQGSNMWITNDIPALGSTVKQTICTQPREGGDTSQAGVQPVQYNWTDNLFYVSRETIGVEYINDWGTQVLDHWAFGPHHAWVDPETGIIVRMWQPFNGLQVLEPGSWEEGAQDPTLFEDLSADGSTAPIPARAEGPSQFRVKCTDDGFYDPDGGELSVSDLRRART